MFAAPRSARSLWSRLATIAAVALVAACGQAPQGGFHGFPPAAVTTLVLQPKTLPVTYEYVGQTAGSKEVEVRARVTGILEKRLFTEGGWVKAGQPLYLIDPKPFEAQSAAADAEVARARAQLAQAEREVARLKPLAEKRAVGQKEADDAASNADLARAALKAAEARLAEVNLNLGYTKVNAPITGLSSRSNKSEGSLVTANDTLLTLLWQVDPIWVPFNVSENDRLGLERAVAAGKLVLPKDNAYDVTIKLSDGSTFPRKGRINFSDTRVNPSTGTYEMRAEIANADGALKPGQFVRVALKGAVAQQRDRGAAGRGAGRSAGQVRLRRGQGQGRQGRRRRAPGHAGRLGRGRRRQPVDRRIRTRRGRHGDRRRHRQAAAGRTDRARRRPGRRRARLPAGPGEGRCRARRQDGAQGRRQVAVAQVLIAEPPPCSRRFFIDRPIFAAVISVFFVLAGLAAMRSLPIAQYPEIAPPVVTVQAVYPGASADVLEQTVAAPLENAINGVQGMIYMNSHSTAQGVTQIAVTFEIGTNVDEATINVNNRVKQVEPRLPLEVRRQGVSVERGSSSFLQVLAFYSPDGRFDDLFTSNYVTLNVLDELKRLPGTTNVQIFGAKDYAMRIWLLPDRMAQLKLTPDDVAAAVNEQNAQFAAGKVGQTPIGGGQDLVYTITTNGRLADPKEFGQIIVRANPDGSTVRLSDVARVELGSKDYDFIGRYNGHEATLVGIFLSPGANALEVAKTVRNRVAALAQRFPEGLTYAIPYDTTRFVEVSITEVVKTLAEAMLLVFLVVYLFLQSWRAALIPFIAVPVSLIGTFAGLYVLGYSINTLTLFGMVLAIGIVVDDAIVVLENVERNMREGKLAPREAAIKAMHEVTGPIIAIVLTLCAVFVPIAFLGGLTGELYRQFAVTISIAVVISGSGRADAVAGAVRADAEARPSSSGPFLPLVQRLVRARHAPLFRRRASG